MDISPYLSVIVPVYNGSETLDRCLEALRHSTFERWELIVVDDGSEDDSSSVAATANALVLNKGKRSGPAAARNLGAQSARGPVLCFIDADCLVHQTTLGRIAEDFENDPSLVAVFGSYDDSPAARGFVAQYKNLMHRYVHQSSSEEAFTFWAGCGAIRKSQFLQLGGFDAARYDRPSIEDIELGYRIRSAGGTIRLDKQIEVKHLKAWTLAGMIRSDIVDRGIPWTRLIHSSRSLPSDLNLQHHHRISALLVWLVVIAAVVTPFFPRALPVVALAAALLLWLNREQYRYFLRHRGPAFALASIPIHWLYYFYSLLSFGAGTFVHLFEKDRGPTRLPPLADRHD